MAEPSRELEPQQPSEPSLAIRPMPPESTGALEEKPEVTWQPKRGGGLMILGAGAILVVANFFEIYPIEISAEHASWRENGYAIVLLIAGSVLTFLGRSVVSTALSLLTGLIMVVLGVVLDYPTTLRMMDVILGAIVLVGSVLSLAATPDE